MSAIYLDSSAFIKSVIEERHTRALRGFLRQRGWPVVSSALMRTEATRAVRFRGPGALASIRIAIRRVSLISIDDRILESAGALDPAIVRTLDAIHLATALALGDDLGLILTYDARMVEGARLLGLPAESPA